VSDPHTSDGHTNEPHEQKSTTSSKHGENSVEEGHQERALEKTGIFK